MSSPTSHRAAIGWSALTLVLSAVISGTVPAAAMPTCTDRVRICPSAIGTRPVPIEDDVAAFAVPLAALDGATLATYVNAHEARRLRPPGV
jgi:hypothetical protein